MRLGGREGRRLGRRVTGGGSEVRREGVRLGGSVRGGGSEVRREG